jgi:TPR repeat protein
VEYYCAFKETFLRDQIASSDESKPLDYAYKHFEHGDVERGHQALADLVNRNHPLALVLASMFSNTDETEDQFRIRHLAQLEVSAAHGNSLALYSLGVYRDTGELLEQDKKLAFEYFKKAAELGMPQAEHIYGVMLYYGTGGAIKDHVRGLALVQSAARSEVAEAKEFLEFLKRKH